MTPFQLGIPEPFFELNFYQKVVNKMPLHLHLTQYQLVVSSKGKHKIIFSINAE